MLLSDLRVVKLSPIAWLTLLHGVILRVRLQHLARKYRRIWAAQGSPLLIESKAFRTVSLSLQMHDDRAPADWRTEAGGCGRSVRFQSRFGKGRWRKPYTVEKVRELVAQGVAALAFFCPDFAVDGIETSEEIALDNRAVFLAAGGGKAFNYVPALTPRQLMPVSWLIW